VVLNRVNFHLVISAAIRTNDASNCERLSDRAEQTFLRMTCFSRGDYGQCDRNGNVAKWNLSPGGRAGKLPSMSAACTKGKHTRCTKEDCTCGDCGHPAPIKKSPQSDFVLDSIFNSGALSAS
jgi:hypothetical protein